jgi:hypothetical protein
MPDLAGTWFASGPGEIENFILFNSLLERQMLLRFQRNREVVYIYMLFYLHFSTKYRNMFAINLLFLTARDTFDVNSNNKFSFLKFIILRKL